MSRTTSTPRLAVIPATSAAKSRSPIIDRVISADVAEIRGLVRVADGRDHRRSERLRELYRAKPDPTRAAVHEERLALLQAAALEHVVPHGEIIFGQARRFQRR